MATGFYRNRRHRRHQPSTTDGTSSENRCPDACDSGRRRSDRANRRFGALERQVSQERHAEGYCRCAAWIMHHTCKCHQSGTSSIPSETADGGVTARTARNELPCFPGHKNTSCPEIGTQVAHKCGGKDLLGIQEVPLIEKSAAPARNGSRSGFRNLRAECHGCLNADRVEYLLEPGNRDGLVIGFFIAADHLLADAQPPRQLGL